MTDEASKLFVARNFTACKDAMPKVNDDSENPTVAHNKVLMSYLANGGDAGSTLSRLGYKSDLNVLDEGSVICFDYDGQEVAVLNQAVVLIHNGQMEKATGLLTSLAQHSGPRLKPSVKARVFVLLSICEKSAAVSQIINTLLADVQPEVHGDPSLLRMTQLALADQSSLEQLYNSSGKSAVDQVILHNNMGVDLTKRGRQFIASLHFVLALRHVFRIADDQLDPFLLETVLFNSGLSALSAAGDEKGLAILDAFLVCQHTMEGSPQLWIRIAQTCAAWLVHHTAQGTLEAYRKKKIDLQTVIKSSGNVPLTDVQLMAIPDNEDVIPTISQSDEKNRLINIGGTAVKNAILLLQADPSNVGILQSVWIQGAFFERVRENAAVSLKYAQEVIAVYQQQHTNKHVLAATPPGQRISNDTMLAAVSYAVESLCFVNRPSAAIKLLQTVSLGELLSSSEAFPGGRKPGVETLFVNLCIAHIAHGSYRQAQVLSSTILARLVVPGQPVSPAGKCGLLLQVVLELAQGSVDRAAELLSKTPLLPPFIK